MCFSQATCRERCNDSRTKLDLWRLAFGVWRSAFGMRATFKIDTSLKQMACKGCFSLPLGTACRLSTLIRTTATERQTPNAKIRSVRNEENGKIIEPIRRSNRYNNAYRRRSEDERNTYRGRRTDPSRTTFAILLASYF